jgi:predicted transposase YbfD/YdcC
MHCTQKKTLDTIVKTGNHYVVAIKRNAKYLFQLLVLLTLKLTDCVDYYKDNAKKSHGRLEQRTVHVFEPNEPIKEYLPHIKSVARIKRTRIKKDKKSEEIVYYISDRELSAKEFYKGIRGHWTIENNLHWVKDVVMLEDKSKYNRKMVEQISILKSLVITIAYQNSKSVINFQRVMSHDIVSMRHLIE